MSDAFDTIPGQPQVRSFLRATVRDERLSHAYLFVGAAGSGKTDAAFALAQAVLCPKGSKGPRGGQCGACDGCGRIRRRKHPDVRYYTPEGANGYLVEQIREIIADASLAPIQASKKVYIIDRADRMGPAAANAFLKTLEEPPDDVLIILLGRTREAVLDTVVSRCQVVPFRTIPADEAAGIVAQNTGVTVPQARIALETCGGSMQRAVAFLKSRTGGMAFRAQVLECLALLHHSDDWDVLGYAANLVKAAKLPLDDVRAEQEAEIEENADFLAKSALRQIEARHKRQITAQSAEYLRQLTSIIRSWLRDCLMTVSGAEDLIINGDAADSIREAAGHATAESLACALKAVDRCDEALIYNVSPETCIDTLLFDVREAIYGPGSTH